MFPEETTYIPTPEEMEENKAADLTELKQSFDLDRDKGNLKIANFLVEKYHIKTVGEREREIYIYENGVYRPGTSFILKWLHSLLLEKCKTHVKKEILEKIKDISFVDRASFTVDINFINLCNGVLDLKTLTLLPHDPKYLFFNIIQVNYLPDTDCPQIKQFLEEILDEEAIQTMQEFIGFGLYRQYFIKKALILVGERDTGKTTLLRVLERFFGKANVSGVSLQKITSDKFSAAHLYHKHLNSFDDLSFKDINDTGAFKIATGGGSITAEYKFGNQFQFENYAKLVFACNKIPDVKETDDEAYFSRWIIARFDKKVEKVDKFLMDKLTTPEELSGLLIFALEGLKRLLEKGNFTYQKNPNEIKAEMMQSGSPVAAFAATAIQKNLDSWVSKNQLYSAFRRYTAESELTALTMPNFGKKITHYARYISDGKKLIGGKQVTGWWNVKINSPYNDPEINDELGDFDTETTDEEILDIRDF